MDIFTDFALLGALLGFLAVTWATASGHLSIEDKVQEAGREYRRSRSPVHGSLSDLYAIATPYPRPTMASVPPRCPYCGRPGKDKNQCPGCGAP